MHPIDWIIMLVPFAAVLSLAVYARKYARDVVDFLAAGRVAGRYVISVGDAAASLSIITLVANCEATYKAGSAMGFWNCLTLPLGMFLSVIAYCTGSWIALKAGWCRPFDLDKLLHRGKWADMGQATCEARHSTTDNRQPECRNVETSQRMSAVGCRMSNALRFLSRTLQRIVGIDDEYTFGDKIIAWMVFFYTIGYRFYFAFVLVVFWNMASPWPKAWWGKYYYVTQLIVPMIVGCFSTVWFLWGGIRDGLRLFRDLDARVTDADDNGFVRHE